MGVHDVFLIQTSGPISAVYCIFINSLSDIIPNVFQFYSPDNLPPHPPPIVSPVMQLHLLFVTMIELQ
jgi:hypothetical protein